MDLKSLANMLGSNVASGLAYGDNSLQASTSGSEECSGFFECTVHDCTSYWPFNCDGLFSCNFGHGGNDFTCETGYTVSHCSGTPPTSIPCPGIP